MGPPFPMAALVCGTVRLTWAQHFLGRADVDPALCYPRLQDLVRKIRYLATIRNKLVHEYGFNDIPVSPASPTQRADS